MKDILPCRKCYSLSLCRHYYLKMYDEYRVRTPVRVEMQQKCKSLNKTILNKPSIIEPFYRVMEGEPIPCLNCVVLPMCKNRYQTSYNRGHHEIVSRAIATRTMETKCSLLSSFLRALTLKSGLSADRLRVFHRFFGNG